MDQTLVLGFKALATLIISSPNISLMGYSPPVGDCLGAALPLSGA
jgi:hypothetical protein